MNILPHPVWICFSHLNPFLWIKEWRTAKTFFLMELIFQMQWRKWAVCQKLCNVLYDFWWKAEAYFQEVPLNSGAGLSKSWSAGFPKMLQDHVMQMKHLFSESDHWSIWLCIVYWLVAVPQDFRQGSFPNGTEDAGIKSRDLLHGKQVPYHWAAVPLLLWKDWALVALILCSFPSPFFMLIMYCKRLHTYNYLWQ